MTRLAVPIVILLLMLFGGAVWMLNVYLDLPQISGDPTAERTRSASKQEATAHDAAAELKDTPAAPIDDTTGSFDVARIDPSGTSVFAGRAAPGANVTIMGDGQALGTAQADENGEWTFATEHQFASADPKLALVVKSAAEVAKEATDRTKVAAGAERRETVAATAPTERQSAKAVTKNLLKNLEGMVEAARTTQQSDLAAKPPGTLPTQESEPAATVAAVALPPQTDRAQEQITVPVPITFVFNEADFTDAGKKAAGLLLEYLRLKQFKNVSLTGHADERGTDQLNLDLSRQRLETVARFLKEGGFTGELDLVPKGETEPFNGVVRSQYGRDDLFQLDRRVELVIKR